MMCSRLLRARGPEHEGALFSRLLRGYDGALKWVLDHHALMLLITFATLGFTIWLYVVVPKGCSRSRTPGSCKASRTRRRTFRSRPCSRVRRSSTK
jgi:multidrug efflux pump subunit AcrB